MKRIIGSLIVTVHLLANTALGMLQQCPLQELQQFPQCGLQNYIQQFNQKQEALVDQTLNIVAKDYGYKYANLQELTKILNDKKLQKDLAVLGFSAQVPSFIGVSSHNIGNYLETHKLNLVQEWNVIVEEITPKVKNETFAKQTLPEKFAKDIQQLGTTLKNFFETQATALEKQGYTKSFVTSLGNYFFGHELFTQNKELLAFIKQAQKNNQKLIVRSTGMEDTKELPNAGGNESIKFVDPTISALLRAIGQVVESYFSTKSFTQRLIAGDKTIFSLPPTPVLIQVMVGTKDHHIKPIECVVHTTEQFGQTAHIASFNCGYGVVDSKQLAHMCFYSTQTKQGHCAFAQNTELLTGNLPQSLAVISKQIEQSYGYPLDIELLIDTKQKIIYLVQARPINAPKKLAQASYIENVTMLQDSLIAARTLVPAGSSVRHITNKQQIIIAKTLNEALVENYLGQGTDKTLVQTIIVHEKAEPSSHEATTFMSEGKLVMIVSDEQKFETIRGLTGSGKFNLYCDPQQHGIIVLQNDKIPVTIGQGYVTHPMPNKMSLLHIDQNHLPMIPFSIQEQLPNETDESLLKILKTELSQEKVHDALASFLTRIKKNVDLMQQLIMQKTSPMQFIAQDALEKLQVLYQNALVKTHDAVASLSESNNKLQRIAVVKPLEMIFEQSNDNRYINIYSVKSVIAQFNQRKNFIEKYLINNVHDQDILHALLANMELFDAVMYSVEVAMTPELEQKCIVFIAAAASATEEQRKQINKILQVLNRFDLMPTWINTSFNTVKGDFSTMLKKLYDTTVGAQETLKYMQEMHQKVKQLTRLEWDNPEKYAKNKEYLEQLVQQAITDDFIKHVQSQNKLAVMVSLKVMESLVDGLDKSIKAVKSSSIHDVNEKVKRFKEMVGMAFKMLTGWAPSAESFIKFYSSWPLKVYLEKIAQIFGETKIESSQLFPSSDFSVTAAALGSNTTFERHYPKTVEDIFTLIHQNLLIIIGTHTKKQIVQHVQKALLVQKIEDFLLKQKSDSDLGNFTMNLVRMGFHGSRFYARYNLPMRHHSSVFDIVYDKISNTVTLQVQFVGERLMRWDAIEATAIANEYMNFVVPRLAKTSLNNKEIILEYLVTTQDTFEAFDHTIKTFIYLANGGSADFVFPNTNDVWAYLTALLKQNPDNGWINLGAHTLLQQIQDIKTIRALTLCDNYYVRLAAYTKLIAQSGADSQDIANAIATAQDVINLGEKQFAQSQGRLAVKTLARVLDLYLVLIEKQSALLFDSFCGIMKIEKIALASGYKGTINQLAPKEDKLRYEFKNIVNNIINKIISYVTQEQKTVLLNKIITLLKTNISTDDSDVVEVCGYVLDIFIEKNILLKEVVDIIQTTKFNDRNYDFKVYYIELLASKGYALDEAFKVANDLLNNPRDTERGSNLLSIVVAWKDFGSAIS